MDIVLLILLLVLVVFLIFILKNKNDNSSNELLIQLTNNLSSEIQNIRKEVGENSEKSRLELESKLSSICLLYTSPSPRDRQKSRMPSSALKKKFKYSSKYISISSKLTFFFLIIFIAKLV